MMACISCIMILLSLCIFIPIYRAAIPPDTDATIYDYVHLAIIMVTFPLSISTCNMFYRDTFSTIGKSF